MSKLICENGITRAAVIFRLETKQKLESIVTSPKVLNYIFNSDANIFSIIDLSQTEWRIMFEVKPLLARCMWEVNP